VIDDDWLICGANIQLERRKNPWLVIAQKRAIDNDNVLYILKD
jgi:hypothetical protein